MKFTMTAKNILSKKKEELNSFVKDVYDRTLSTPYNIDEIKKSWEHNKNKIDISTDIRRVLMLKGIISEELNICIDNVYASSMSCLRVKECYTYSKFYAEKKENSDAKSNKLAELLDEKIEELESSYTNFNNLVYTKGS